MQPPPRKIRIKRRKYPWKYLEHAVQGLQSNAHVYAHGTDKTEGPPTRHKLARHNSLTRVPRMYLTMRSLASLISPACSGKKHRPTPEHNAPRTRPPTLTQFAAPPMFCLLASKAALPVRPIVVQSASAPCYWIASGVERRAQAPLVMRLSIHTST